MIGGRVFALFCTALLALPLAAQARYARDPGQAVDEAYGRKIREYTTAPHFLTPLVDYLPASKTVPTPASALGDVAGAPGRLPYVAEIHAYFRALEKTSPRVKVLPLGRSEEGREMIAVAIADAKLLAGMDANRQRLAKLADPRAIRLDDTEADRLVAASAPLYWITGALHSPETGAPTALMELAYRLAVDEAPYLREIRSKLITVITPVLEVDGRDRQVDLYRWHLAHPKEQTPPLVYWGRYLAHDNNRDGMVATLALTRAAIDFFAEQKVQVLHDLHESVPYLYDNTVGDGPFNAWIDPLLADEWQQMGWSTVAELTRLGLPGVFAHGTFDTWSPGYLMFVAAMRNGTSRLFETFGNAGADTQERVLRPQEFARTWYRPNPPFQKTLWSQRNNNNYQQSALLVSLSHYAANAKGYLKNFYLKAKRSVQKARSEGPAAYVFPADDPRPGLQAQLLQVLQTQRVEVHRATAPFTVQVPAARKPPLPGDSKTDSAQGPKPPALEPRTFPPGSFLVRMDQPYSRLADALLDHQYWSAADPQKNPYDDTGWTLGELFQAQVVRVADPKALDAAMAAVTGKVQAHTGIEGGGQVLLLNHDADPNLLAFRYRLKDLPMEAVEEPFQAGGRTFNRGTLVLRDGDAARKAAAELGLKLHAVAEPPKVKSHPVGTPRIGYVHSWLSTQDEGWWRLELDRLGIPYTYLSVQAVAQTADLRSKYDVLLFPPVGRPPQAVIAGLPLWGAPLPWKKTELTPNLGTPDATDDVRPGLGWSGLANMEAFVRGGGLLVTTDDTSDLAVSAGWTRGVTAQRSPRLKAPGSVLRAKVVDAASPVAYGYGEGLSVYASNPLALSVSRTLGGRPRRAEDGEPQRPTGRGTAEDPDIPQGRPFVAPEEEPKVEPWQAAPLTAEHLRNPLFVIPVRQRPRVVLRYGDAKELLVSGLLEAGGEIAKRPAVIDVPVDRGHVLLFSINPIWRGETRGSYALVFNAILHWDRLDAGLVWDEK